MSEQEQAKFVANKFLDELHADPDGDQCVLARQYMRSLETVQRRDALIVDLQAQIEALKADLKKSEERYRLLATSINTHPGDCLPECDSYGHAEGCTHSDDIALFLQLTKELDEAKVTLARYESGRCAMVAEIEGLRKRLEPDDEPDLDYDGDW